VAGGAFEVALRRILLRGVRSADGIVRAEGAHVEGERKVLSELPSLLDEASGCPRFALPVERRIPAMGSSAFAGAQ
jgi:hypothetical protein